MTFESQATQIKEKYLQHLRFVKNLSERTVFCYEESLNIFFSFLDTNALSFTDFSQSGATLFVKYLLNSNLSPSSVNRHLSAVKGYFNFAQKHNLFPQNPFIWIKGRKRGAKIPNFLTFEEMQEIIHLFDTSTLFDDMLSSCIISILVFTGIRRSELLSLRLDDIDFESFKILVNGKGNKDRYVYFTQFCKDRIVKYLSFRPKTKNSKLLLHQDGREYTSLDLGDLFDKINESGFTLKHITPHVLRHSFATLLVDNNVDLSYVQTLLGHSSILSTDVYVHTSRSKIFSIYDRAFKNSSSIVSGEAPL